MSGFAATGIYPVDSNIFSETDFVLAEISGENECANENSTDLRNTQTNENREIIVFDDIPANEVEVSRTSGLSRSTLSLDETLRAGDPLHHVTPKKKIESWSESDGFKCANIGSNKKNTSSCSRKNCTKQTEKTNTIKTKSTK